MKKIKNKILLVLAALCVAFGFSFAPLIAQADDASQTNEIVVETPEISSDNTADEEELETNANSAENSKPVIDEHTFEEFLAWSEKEANRYGYGDEYSAALETIKAAASQKQVTLSTIASAVVAAAVVAYIIFNKIKEKKLKGAIIELAQKLDSQLTGVNALIDGENALLNGEKELLNTESTNAKTVQETMAQVVALKKGFSAFISAFLRFTDGVKLVDNKKTEVQTNCLNALKEIDGEVKADENHKE